MVSRRDERSMDPTGEDGGGRAGVAAAGSDDVEPAPERRQFRSFEQLEKELPLAFPGFDVLLNTGLAVFFVWPIKPGWPVLFVSRNIEQFGYKAEDLMSGAVSWPGITHPDDVPRLEAEVATYIAEGQTAFSQEYRLLTPSGAVRWVEDRSTLCFDENGEFTHILGMVVDVTERKHAEIALRRSETLLLRGQRIAKMASWVMDVQSESVEWSEQAFRIAGMAENTRPLTMEQGFAFIHPQDRATVRHAIERAIRTKKPMRITHRVLLPSGGVRTMLSQAELIEDGGGRAPRLVGVGMDITEQEATRNELEHSQRMLRALGARLARLQEAERRQLARELHDRVGQNLLALGMTLNTLRKPLVESADGKALARLEDALKLVDETTGSIRNVMAELRPPVLDDLGILPALRWHARQFAERFGIAVAVRGSDMVRFPQDTEVALFRIAQEALNNVAKHAKASRVIISLSAYGRKVILRISDNGEGFTAGSSPDRSWPRSWGLITMRERGGAVGAEVDIRSNPGRGTVVLVTLPALAALVGPPSPGSKNGKEPVEKRQPRRNGAK